MQTLTPSKKLCISAVCIALCCIVPMAFHSVGLGSAFGPMHIPVYLCGLICGSLYGFLCGIIGPVLSSVITGMPAAAMLVSMVPEIMVYGLVTGICMRYIRTGHLLSDIYIAMPAAMLLGRIVGGIAKALFYFGTGQSFGIAMWISTYFVTSLPGILCHLLIVPLLYCTLQKARLIPRRYWKGENHG